MTISRDYSVQSIASHYELQAAVVPIRVVFAILADINNIQKNSRISPAEYAARFTLEINKLVINDASDPSMLNGDITGSTVKDASFGEHDVNLVRCGDNPDWVMGPCPLTTEELKSLAPEVGSSAVLAGVALAFFTLACTCICVLSAWCKRFKRGYWSPGGCWKSTGKKKVIDHDTPFKQQQMHVWEPSFSVFSIIASYIAVGIILVPFGLLFRQASHAVVDVTLRYDNIPQCTPGGTCQVSFTIPEEMPAPVFFYYHLTNFYQNHRNYVKSRDAKQIRNHPTSKKSDCAPAIYYEDYIGSDGAKGPLAAQLGGKEMYPCGLIAQVRVL
jgi:hypothetical protein